jgi:hypothetical protein
MESKGGQEADYAARNQLGSESQAVVLGDGRIGEHVDSPSATLEQTTPFEAGQEGAGNPKRLHVPWTNEALAGGKLQNAFGRGHLLLVGSFAYLPTQCNKQPRPLTSEPTSKRPLALWARFACIGKHRFSPREKRR